MKNLIRLTSVLAFMIFLSSFATAQRTNTRSFSAVTPQQKQDLYMAAKMGRQDVGLLLPAVQKVREAARYNGPSIQKIVNAYKNQCDILIRTKGRMSSAQYANMEAKFAKLEKDLDKYIAQNSPRKPASRTFASNSGGGNQGSEFSECFKDCHNSFPGIGGGAGANRFACKFGCFVEATGGAGRN
ncbi:MAG: hypothetical protein Sapg2KO_35150 [Saprospiraceae bacterium]